MHYCVLLDILQMNTTAMVIISMCISMFMVTRRLCDQ